MEERGIIPDFGFPPQGHVSYADVITETDSVGSSKV
jgi:hypothetical protein